MASRHCVPARATRRGGVRLRRRPESFAVVSANPWRIGSRPLTVWIFQVRARRSRQWLSGWKRPDSAAPPCPARALSNPASHRSAVRSRLAAAAGPRERVLQQPRERDIAFARLADAVGRRAQRRQGQRLALVVRRGHFLDRTRQRFALLEGEVVIV